MKALRAAAQDRRVPRLEGQSAGIGGDVGPALIDDADDAERHGDPLDREPVGARPVGEHAADRVGELGDRLEPGGDRLDPLRIECKTVA